MRSWCERAREREFFARTPVFEPQGFAGTRNLDIFLEKNKLKDDSSNDADLVRDLRIILIAAQKNYVLDAPCRGFVTADVLV